MIHRLLSLLVSGKHTLLCTTLGSLCLLLLRFPKEYSETGEIEYDHKQYIEAMLLQPLHLLLNWGILVLIAGLAHYLNKRYRIIWQPSKLPFVLLLLLVFTRLLHTLTWHDSLAAFCTMLLFFPLCNSYMKLIPVSDFFHAGLLLSTASLFTPQLLLLYPVMLYGFYLFRVLKFKGILASFVGLILPYWLYFAYCFMANDFTYFTGWKEAFTFSFIPLEHYHWSDGVLLTFFSISLLLALVRSQTHSYGDKVQSRLFLRFSFLLLLASLAGIICFYQASASFLYLLLIVATFPLAHYFTLVKEVYATVLFYLLCAVFLFSYFFHSFLS